MLLGITVLNFSGNQGKLKPPSDEQHFSYILTLNIIEIPLLYIE